jgi:hypothetical protein
MSTARTVFEGGAQVRRRIARAVVLIAGAGLVAWVGLVATAVVPNGGTVELPDFVTPLQQAVAPATSNPASGAPSRSSGAPAPTNSARPAIVIPPLPFFPTPTPAQATPAPTATPAATTNGGGGPNATFPGHTPERTPRPTR